MAWDKIDDTIVFECDSCSETVECDIERVRATAKPSPNLSDFGHCCQYLLGIGWRSFKRIGHPWTYHCIKCGPDAEVQHREHKRQERERDRVRARNAA